MFSKQKEIKNIMKNKKTTFSFGRNWIDYVKNFLNEKQLDIAKESLFRYLPEEEYKNKTLIDIGCGSGIFSLNALRSGCKKVVSFDVDEYSVNATNLVKNKFFDLIPKNSEWNIFKASILDGKVIDKLRNTGDIVYSWGVLHHTGSMWEAIKNAAQIVKPQGYFILAIYNKASSSEYWLSVKKFYNQSPRIIKVLLAHLFFAYIIFRRLGSYVKALILGRKKPFSFKDILERERGMSIFYDVIDWLGGYPYEYASFEEIKNFVEKLGFKLIKAPTKLFSIPKTFFNQFSFHCTGNNEFVFQKNETN